MNTQRCQCKNPDLRFDGTVTCWTCGLPPLRDANESDEAWMPAPEKDEA